MHVSFCSIQHQTELCCWLLLKKMLTAYKVQYEHTRAEVLQNPAL